MARNPSRVTLCESDDVELARCRRLQGHLREMVAVSRATIARSRELMAIAKASEFHGRELADLANWLRQH